MSHTNSTKAEFWDLKHNPYKSRRITMLSVN